MHQNFDDFTFVTGKIIGNKLTLKGEIDSRVAIDLTNKASMAFLQKHLGKKQHVPLLGSQDQIGT